MAVYAQHKNQTKFIDFNGIAAGVSREVYLLALSICCLLIILFAIIEYVKQSNKFNLWDVILAVLPCFNSQARKNTPNRATPRGFCGSHLKINKQSLLSMFNCENDKWVIASCAPQANAHHCKILQKQQFIDSECAPPGTRIGTFTIAVARCGDYINEYFCVHVHNILHNIAAQYYFIEALVEPLLKICNSKTFLKSR